CMRADVISHEELSRCHPERREGSRLRDSRPATDSDGRSLVIIDESHRCRSPQTRRYAAVAELCQRSQVLLLSATPIQNRGSDLAAQLALFLGREAWQESAESLATHVVRTGDDAHRHELPALDGPHRVPLGCEDEC